MTLARGSEQQRVLVKQECWLSGWKLSSSYANEVVLLDFLSINEADKWGRKVEIENSAFEVKVGPKTFSIGTSRTWFLARARKWT